MSLPCHPLRDQALIVGFSVADGAKPVLIHAFGPALTAFGLSGVPNRACNSIPAPVLS